MNPMRCDSADGRGRQVVGWLGVAALLGVAGCGGVSVGAPALLKVYEVKGKVLRPDGQALSGGQIYFVPKEGSQIPSGQIGRDGTFSLSTGPSGEGAPEGEYKVRIEPEDPTLLALTTNRAKKPLPFARRYWDEDTSGLTATVKPSANQLQPFRLKSN